MQGLQRADFSRIAERNRLEVAFRVTQTSADFDSADAEIAARLASRKAQSPSACREFLLDAEGQRQMVSHLLEKPNTPRPADERISAAILKLPDVAIERCPDMSFPPCGRGEYSECFHGWAGLLSEAGIHLADAQWAVQVAIEDGLLEVDPDADTHITGGVPCFRVSQKLWELWNSDSKRGEPLTPLQAAIMKALNGKSMPARMLATACGVDPGRLFRKIKGKRANLSLLMDLGLVKNKPGVGYYRPDAPP